MHPLGKAPVLVDDGAVLAESGAIVEHLLETRDGGGLLPAAGSPEHRRYRFWLHHAEGSAMPLLTMRLTFAVLPRRTPALLRPMARLISNGVQRRRIDPQIALFARVWEDELARDGWFAGADFSAADIQMSYPVEAAAGRLGLGETHPNIARFIAAIRARPAYRRALEASGDERAVL